MTRISIIGGGRWARTIAGVASSLPDAPERITIHSPRNAASIASWISARKSDGRIDASDTWPDFSAASGRPDAVIVANQVADHVEAASGALRAGVPVLVEKPMAITADRIQGLCDLAAASSSTLASSNVFLFSRYFDNFASFVATQDAIRNISCTWTDGPADIREGEVKSYDQGVSVFDDVLPHVVPLINRLKPGIPALTSVDIQNGGAHMRIEGRLARAGVSIFLARNGSGRRRLITVETDRGTCSLDFSAEPGVISGPGRDGTNGDLQWDQALRPLGSMLTAFLEHVRGASLDARLSPQNALASAAFADSVRTRYLASQRQWLRQRLGAPPEPALDYALLELGLATDWPSIGDASALETRLAEATFLGA